MATLLAFPTLWVVNHNSEDRSPAAPNAGAIGLEVEGGDDSTTTTLDRRANLDRAAAEPSIFISADRRRATRHVVEIATPTSEGGELVRGNATFSSGIASAALCVGMADEGTTLTVRNVNNNRSTTCLVVGRTDRVDPEPGTIVLERNTYLQIASASDAPVPVEIRR